MKFKKNTVMFSVLAFAGLFFIGGHYHPGPSALVSPQVEAARATEKQIDPLWIDGEVLQFAMPDPIKDTNTVVRLNIATGGAEIFPDISQSDYTDLAGKYSQNIHPQNEWVKTAKQKAAEQRFSGTAQAGDPGSFNYLNVKVVTAKKGSVVYLPDRAPIPSTIRNVLPSMDGSYVAYIVGSKEEDPYLLSLEKGEVLWAANRGSNEFRWSPGPSNYLAFKYAGEVYLWVPGMEKPGKITDLIRQTP